MLQVHTHTCRFTDSRDVPAIIIKAKLCSMIMMAQGSKGGEAIQPRGWVNMTSGHSVLHNYVCTQNAPFTSEPSLAPCPYLHLFALPEWRNKVDIHNRLNGGAIQ